MSSPIKNTFDEEYFIKSCRGYPKIKVYENGKLIQVIRKENLITFKMKEALAGIGVEDSNFDIAYFKVGTLDTPPPGHNQGDLANPVFQKNITGIQFITANNIARVQLEMLPQEGPQGTYKEMGLFTSNNKMVSRILIIPNITYTDLTQFGVEWDLEFT